MCHMLLFFRREELEESLGESLGALENERKSHDRTQAEVEKVAHRTVSTPEEPQIS